MDGKPVMVEQGTTVLQVVKSWILAYSFEASLASDITLWFYCVHRHVRKQECRFLGSATMSACRLLGTVECVLWR